jgi:Ran GTPase-activating protein (RanGAP) involved in mRNA processing and transport
VQLALGFAKSTHILNEKGNEITNRGAIALADALKANIALKNLDLSFNKIENEGVIAIGEGVFCLSFCSLSALKENKSLTQLNLEGNKFSGEASKVILEALKVNKNLSVLKGLEKKKISNKVEIKQKLNKNKKNAESLELRQEIKDIRSAFRFVFCIVLCVYV